MKKIIHVLTELYNAVIKLIRSCMHTLLLFISYKLVNVFMH